MDMFLGSEKIQQAKFKTRPQSLELSAGRKA